MPATGGKAPPGCAPAAGEINRAKSASDSRSLPSACRTSASEAPRERLCKSSNGIALNSLNKTHKHTLPNERRKSNGDSSSMDQISLTVRDAPVTFAANFGNDTGILERIKYYGS